MKKRNSTQIMQITVLLLFLTALFLPKNTSSYLLPVLATLGISISFLLLIIPVFRKQFSKISRKQVVNIRQSNMKSNPDLEVILTRQISYQITDHLKGSYPDATWEFVSPFRLSDLLDGHSIRLVTYNTGTYNFAEVSMDQYGNLNLQMMTVEALKQRGKKDSPSEDSSINPQAWYSLIGKPMLIHLIGDLQAKGYQKLFINDQGDVYVLNGKEPEIKGRLEQFPPKDYWSVLSDIFADDDLTATETEKSLELSWM